MKLSKGFSAPKANQAAAGNETRPTLLVVDDEHEITSALADQFRGSYHVVTAGGVDEALAVLKKQPVSVIVADQRMPGKTGSELLAETVQIDPDIVRILLTGYADIEGVIQAVNEGKIFFYLTKPWNSQELSAVIAKAMEHNFLLRDNRRLVEELRRINAELEARVKERTAQLEDRARELEEANRKISDLVYLDPLTGVANRRSLDETMAREAERAVRLNLALTVILLDVDHFKTVNDSFGHAMGDKVLSSIAAAVSGLVRTYDMVARYGGEEFLIIMPGATLENAALAAGRFRTAIGSLCFEGIPGKVTASFGVARLLPGMSPQALFEQADAALYHAKKNGRNRVEVFTGKEASNDRNR